jgi:YHS domain-containing protein
MMRQIGKEILTIAALVTALLVATPVSAASVITAIVTDPLSGVAIDGYDPVTYFTDPEPRQGKPDFEYYWGGVPWYFVSAANRDVFIRAPEVYAPQYGGYCEMALARGYLSDGKPGIYLVRGDKLYLFYSTANRDAFELAEAEAQAKAGANWPKLSATLIAERSD